MYFFYHTYMPYEGERCYVPHKKEECFNHSLCLCFLYFGIKLMDLKLAVLFLSLANLRHGCLIISCFYYPIVCVRFNTTAQLLHISTVFILFIYIYFSYCISVVYLISLIVKISAESVKRFFV